MRHQYRWVNIRLKKQTGESHRLRQSKLLELFSLTKQLPVTGASYLNLLFYPRWYGTQWFAFPKLCNLEWAEVQRLSSSWPYFLPALLPQPFFLKLRQTLRTVWVWAAAGLQAYDDGSQRGQTAILWWGHTYTMPCWFSNTTEVITCFKSGWISPPLPPLPKTEDRVWSGSLEGLFSLLHTDCIWEH